MIKVFLFRSLLVVSLCFLFQVCINAQQETVPDNGVLLINKTDYPVTFRLIGTDGKWRDVGYQLLPKSDTIKVEVTKIAIYDSNNKLGFVGDLVFKTRYKFFINPETNFWAIKALPR